MLGVDPVLTVYLVSKEMRNGVALVELMGPSSDRPKSCSVLIKVDVNTAFIATLSSLQPQEPQV